MVTTAPATPSVLAWAIEEDGRDLHSVAEELDVDPDSLDSWLHGDAQPTSGEVTRLAKVLRRPRAVFFLPAPPRAATLPASFRHPPGEDTQVSNTARNHVRRARRIQEAMSWALRDEPDVEIPRAAGTASPESSADIARKWLAVSDADQAHWRDDYAALRSWRTALEDRQILVFALEIGKGEIRGFSAWDEKAPLIATNSSGVNPAARCFTVMHELGHLFLRQDAACVDTPTPAAEAAVERWCEQFGAAVLMPSAEARQWANGRGITQGGATIDDVAAMMRRFRVSARAAALRLITFGLARRDLYAEVLRTFVPKPPAADQRVFSAPRPTLRRRQYGDRVLRTVINDLPPRDALSVLRLEVSDARSLADEVPGVREL